MNSCSFLTTIHLRLPNEEHSCYYSSNCLLTHCVGCQLEGSIHSWIGSFLTNPYRTPEWHHHIASYRTLLAVVRLFVPHNHSSTTSWMKDLLSDYVRSVFIHLQTLTMVCLIIPSCGRTHHSMGRTIPSLGRTTCKQVSFAALSQFSTVQRMSFAALSQFFTSHWMSFRNYVPSVKFSHNLSFAP